MFLLSMVAASSGGEITAYVVGIGGLLTGAAAFIQAKSQSKKDVVDSSSIGEASLANAVKVVEEVYNKVTGQMNVAIDELLEDNKRLREDVGSLRLEVATLTQSERDCKAEVMELRNEVRRGRHEP